MGSSVQPIIPDAWRAALQGGGKAAASAPAVQIPREWVMELAKSPPDQPKPEQPGVLERSWEAVKHLATHPQELAQGALSPFWQVANVGLPGETADPNSFANQAADVTNARLGIPMHRFAKQPAPTQTPGALATAGAQAGAELALPGVTGAVEKVAARALPESLARLLARGGVGAAGGAALNPNDPGVGAVLGGTAGAVSAAVPSRAAAVPPVPEETPALAPTPPVAEPTVAPTPEAPNARPVVARTPDVDVPRGNTPVGSAPPPESVQRVTGGEPPTASGGAMAGSLGEPEPVGPALAKARAQWGLNEPPEGSPAGTPAAKLVNPDLLALSPEGQGELQSQLEQLKAQGFDKRIVSFPEQQAQARDFAQQLGLDPLSVDPQKYGRLTGAEILGMKNVVVKNIGEITDLSKQIAVGQMSTADIEQASARLDALRNDNDVLLRGVVTASGQAGRDLGFLRTMAQGTLDPDAWMVQAQKIAGNRALSDEEITSVRALAKAAQDACLGEGA